MSKRTCTVDGCSKPHRARGLCVTHYNRTLGPSRHRKVEMPCDYCGQMMRKPKRSDRKGRFCSMLCRDLWRIEQPDDPMYTAMAKRAQNLAERWSALPPDHPALNVCPISSRVCTCGTSFIVRHGTRTKYCSEACRERARNSRKRRRHIKRRTDVFERDGYRCWLCGEETSRTYSADDVWSPTIDHLIPVSRGGTDDEGNLGTAHMWCNSIRGNSMAISPAA